MELCVCQAPAGSQDCSTSREEEWRGKGRERLNMCYNWDLFKSFLHKGFSRASHVTSCHSQSSYLSPSSVPSITISTFCFPFCLHAFSQFLFPPVSMRSFLIPSSSSVSFISHSPFPLRLNRPSALRVFITVLNGHTSFLECR